MKGVLGNQEIEYHELEIKGEYTYIDGEWIY